MEQRIVIRHLGADAKVQEFPVESLVDVVFGREEGCSVHFDSGGGEVVSRRHAKLNVTSRNPLSVALTDLDSRNGTFVNHHRIQGAARLSPGDRVQLGAGGPEFLVDVFPRPVPAEVTVPSDVPARQQEPATLPVPAAAGPLQKPPVAVSVRRPHGAPVTSSRKVVLLGGAGLFGVGVLLLLCWVVFGRGAGELAVKVYHQPTVMTVAYKTYGNPEAARGKYWFAKSVIENTGKGSLRHVKILGRSSVGPRPVECPLRRDPRAYRRERSRCRRHPVGEREFRNPVSYQIPDYIPWTTPDGVAEILPGETVVFVYYPKFPAKVTNIRTRTPATLEVKIESDGGAEQQPHLEKRDFEFRGLSEFAYTNLPSNEILTYYDIFDNDPLLSSFVTDEDLVVKTFYAKVSEASGGISTMDKGKDMIAMAKSVYDYMVSLGMTYSGAKGVPDKAGDVNSLVQSIRMPRDVIYGNSGLCIELALLWCSIAQTAGAKAYLVLIPGHAFAILEAGDGTKLPIECTGIGGGAGGNLNPAMTFEQAVKSADKTFGDTRDRREPMEIMDIQSYQARGIRPPELEAKDLAELSKLLDDRRHGSRRTVVYRQVAETRQPAAVPQDTGIAMRVWQDPNGTLAVPYPVDWTVNTQAIAAIRRILPGYAFAAGDISRRCSVDVCFFTAPNLQSVMNQYSAALRQFGAAANLGVPSQISLGSRSVMTFPITVSGAGGTFAGTLVVAPVRGGFAMVGVSAAQPGADTWRPIMSRILGGIRFGA